MNQRECILVLHKVLGLGADVVLGLKNAFSLCTLFEMSEEELTELPGIGTRRAKRLVETDPEKTLKGLKAEIEEANCQVVTAADDDFPQGLFGKKGAPAVLFYKGNLGLLSTPVVSIVGTRRASSYGNQVAYSMARDMTIQGVMVASGMAIGIDTAAHQGALEKGPTIAVLGSGLAQVYPPQNLKLADKIAESGLLLSPFTPATSPARWTFPRRNRLMAALSRAVVVVEAGEKSGALLTAQYAKEMDIPVFAVPGRIDSAQSKGVLNLLKNGAKVATGANDVLEHLSIHPRVESGRGGDELKGRELLVWKALEEGDLPPEVIAQKTGVGLSEIWEVLLEMEMKGLISQAVGGVYSRRAM